MYDKRGKWIGEPTIITTIEEASPEQVEKNRKGFEAALSRVYSKMCHEPMQVKVLWPEEPPEGIKKIMREQEARKNA